MYNWHDRLANAYFSLLLMFFFWYSSLAYLYLQSTLRMKHVKRSSSLPIDKQLWYISHIYWTIQVSKLFINRIPFFDIPCAMGEYSLVLFINNKHDNLLQICRINRIVHHDKEEMVDKFDTKDWHYIFYAKNDEHCDWNIPEVKSVLDQVIVWYWWSDMKMRCEDTTVVII